MDEMPSERNPSVNAAFEELMLRLKHDVSLDPNLRVEDLIPGIKAVFGQDFYCNSCEEYFEEPLNKDRCPHCRTKNKFEKVT